MCDVKKTIIFDYTGVVISFVEAMYTVPEAIGTSDDDFCIELCSGSPKRDFSFYVDVLSSSATSNN